MVEESVINWIFLTTVETVNLPYAQLHLQYFTQKYFSDNVMV